MQSRELKERIREERFRGLRSELHRWNLLKAALAVSQFHSDLSSSSVMGLTDYLNLQVMRQRINLSWLQCC